MFSGASRFVLDVQLDRRAAVPPVGPPPHALLPGGGGDDHKAQRVPLLHPEDAVPSSPTVVHNSHVLLTDEDLAGGHDVSDLRPEMNLVTENDTVLTYVVWLFVLLTVLSSLADHLTLFLGDDPPSDPLMIVLFCIGDVAEDFTYGAGFFYIQVCFRLLCLRVRAVHEQRLHEASERVDVSPDLWLSLRCDFEQAFVACHNLSSAVAAPAMVMMLLAAIEVSSTVQSVFVKDMLHPDVARYSMIRLLLMVSAEIFVFVYMAASVQWESHTLSVKLSEAAAAAAAVRVAHAHKSHESEEPALDEEKLAGVVAVFELATALRERVDKHPASVRVGAFELSMEYANTLSVVVVSLLLTVVGIRSPVDA